MLVMYINYVGSIFHVFILFELLNMVLATIFLSDRFRGLLIFIKLLVFAYMVRWRCR